MALTWTEHDAPTSYDDAYRKMDYTADFWHDWLSHGTFPDHPWRQYLERSALTLKGLTYAPTGAMCAAATTSLPETPGGERNWDYRYSWIRDSTFMLWGLYSLGFAQEAGDYYYFIEDVASGDRDLQIMYGIGGEHELPESTLDHLEGYEHAKPVRIGNGAYNQDQHDVWGALLDSFYIHTKNRDQLPESAWPILCKQVEMAISRWREPDRSIWEVRGEPQHFTSSKVFCWVACDRGVKLARLRNDTERAERWQQVADEIHADVCANGLDPERNRFVQRYGSDALDASLLLLPLFRFLPRRRHPRAQHGLRHRRRADRRRHGAALPRRTRPTTASTARRARSRSARSGSCPRWSRSASSAGRASSARSCWRTPRRSRCTPRRSTRPPAATWATSRRRSRTWR